MIAFIVGSLVGVAYFGGLYLTVKKMSEVKRPALLMTVSFILRMAILVVVFFFISQRGYKSILLALLGVVVVRFIMIFAVKDQNPNSIKSGD